MQPLDDIGVYCKKLFKFYTLIKCLVIQQDKPNRIGRKAGEHLNNLAFLFVPQNNACSNMKNQSFEFLFRVLHSSKILTIQQG